MQSTRTPPHSRQSVQLRAVVPEISIGQGCTGVIGASYVIRLPCVNGKREVILVTYEQTEHVLLPERDNPFGEGTLPPVIACTTEPRVQTLGTERCRGETTLHAEEVSAAHEVSA